MRKSASKSLLNAVNNDVNKPFIWCNWKKWEKKIEYGHKVRSFMICCCFSSCLSQCLKILGSQNNNK